MIASPESTKREHLDLLQKISKLSYEDELLEKLINTTEKVEVKKILGSL